MKKILLYGPIRDGKVGGGYERMNDNIMIAFEGDENIKIIPLSTLKNKLKKPFKYIFYPFMYLKSMLSDLIKLGAYCNNENINGLHITSLYGVFIVREYFMLKKANKIGIDTYFDIRAGNFLDCYEKSKFKFIYDYCLTKSTKVLVEGNKYKEYLSNKSIESIYFPNLTNIPTEEEVIEKKFNSDIKCLYIGRVVPEKGIEDSVRLINGMLDKGFNKKIKFYIVGPYEKEIKQLILDSYPDSVKFISFEGHKNERELKTYLNDCNLFMFLTKWQGEGHSNSLNEAIAYGMPVLFYDQGFTRDIIGNDTFLLEKDNMDKNVDKLIKILNNEEILLKESIRLRMSAKEKYNLTNIKNILLKIY